MNTSKCPRCGDALARIPCPAPADGPACALVHMGCLRCRAVPCEVCRIPRQPEEPYGLCADCLRAGIVWAARRARINSPKQPPKPSQRHDPVLDPLPVASDEVFKVGTAAGNSRRLSVTFAADCAEEALAVFEAKAPDEPRLREALAAARAWALEPSQEAALACREASKGVSAVVQWAERFNERRGKAIVNPPRTVAWAVLRTVTAVFGDQPPHILSALAALDASTALVDARLAVRQNVSRAQRARLEAYSNKQPGGIHPNPP